MLEKLRPCSLYYRLAYGSSMTKMCDLLRRTTITTRQGVLELLTTVDRRCLHISQRAERLSSWPGLEMALVVDVRCFTGSTDVDREPAFVALGLITVEGLWRIFGMGRNLRRAS